MTYLFGAAKALQQARVATRCRFIGSSAGALTACGLVLDSDFDKVMQLTVDKYARQCRSSFWGPFRIREYMIDCLKRTGNLHRFAELGQGSSARSLTVCYTELLPALSARRQSRFESRADLETALVASSTAVPIAGLPWVRNGRLVMDGGFLDLQPEFENGRTVTISPFFFANSDIRPSRYVPAWWAVYPPDPAELQWTFHLGYKDTVAWVQKNHSEVLPWILQSTVPARGLGDGKEKQGKVCGERLDHERGEAKGSVLSIFRDDLLAQPPRPRERSLRRFLGYNFRSRILDFLFLAALWLFWRPVAFVVLYWELAVRAVFYAFQGVFMAVLYVLILDMASAGIALSRGVDRVVREIRCVLSLSLLLSTVPYYNAHLPAPSKHRKYKVMLTESFVYRLCHHIL